jgi:hypothetical protein
VPSRLSAQSLCIHNPLGQRTMFAPRAETSQCSDDHLSTTLLRSRHVRGKHANHSRNKLWLCTRKVRTRDQRPSLSDYLETLVLSLSRTKGGAHSVVSAVAYASSAQKKHGRLIITLPFCTWLRRVTAAQTTAWAVCRSRHKLGHHGIDPSG